MPLIIKDYSWTQTESTVYINVPLKGTKVAKVDLLSTDEYLKVHFPPFLFEAFLFEPVIDEKSIAQIGNGVAAITLQKRAHGPWEHLMIKNSNKEQMQNIRERALLKYQETIATDAKAKDEKKRDDKKYALDTMMKLELEEKERIKKARDDEVTVEVESWKQKEEKVTINEPLVKIQGPSTISAKMNTSSNTHMVKCDPSSSKKRQVNVPAPRSIGHIQLKFTPRGLPTPLRESRLPEEEEWLRKQAEARRAISADLAEMEDLKEEERNPDWLKEKGDKCFSIGNYLGAVNAYNLAIKLNGIVPALYSNRAACHLKLRHFHKAIEDSSKALDLLTPPVPDNASARVRAHVRRGTAFCELELYAEGLQDYQAALMIAPQNESLQADAQRIRLIIQGSASGQVDLCEEQEKNGDGTLVEAESAPQMS